MQYRKYDEYKFMHESINGFCRIILLSFAKEECEIKDIILRNSIAKASMSLKGIFAQWDIKNYQDGWAMYRNVLDRLFHIEHIAQNNQFQEFADWSIYQQAIKQNLVKSDIRFQNSSPPLNAKMKARVKELLKNKPTWKRPKAEDVAKSMEMDFLYKYGFDMATMHTHPMSNDGAQDFHSITGIPTNEEFPDQITLLHNSILVVTLIIQNVLNYSSPKWRNIMWDFIEQLRFSLNDGNKNYGVTFIKIANKFGEQSTLCAENV
ncbi:hypothetical protein J8L70_15950 [Pseudoalteromonas sp. MMG010]|uniref:DUF5677 domain-containing protein n=1 Tax=Pseudoalteromonas sp. MMG010 TaxID=2822685 RepID=UPI001B39ED97|nr:DUF5677 domain-containing protein [Pseudoalteromonas sp. MMG010]MBQ4834716.1 hypothetical protein [Pseudoalteromonas sp. MMG010]